jgi:hypothetical protein
MIAIAGCREVTGIYPLRGMSIGSWVHLLMGADASLQYPLLHWLPRRASNPDPTLIPGGGLSSNH